MPEQRRGPGRPKGQRADGRTRILAAARQEFAAKGLSGATMRAIAARAGVDVALLPHYFGNKAGLFEAAMELPAAALGALERALASPPHSRGEHLAREYLGLWENPETSTQVISLARSAMTDDAAAALLRASLMRLMEGAAIDERIGSGRTGFALAMTQLLGVALARHIVQVPPVRALPFDALVSRLGPQIQRQLEP